MNESLLREKTEKGWLHARMFFEVLAIEEEVTKKSLREHLDKINKMDNIKIVSEKFEEVTKIDKPKKGIDVAYSQIVDVDVVVSSFENLLYSVIFFGPSSIEIIEPKKFELNVTEAQNMVNAVAEIMHKYAAGGAGGIVISAAKK